MSNKHRDHIERRYNLIMDAFGSVIDYNMPDDYVDNLIIELNIHGENFHPALCDGYMRDSPITWVLWQLIIIMYGDYGTSPRSGWITNLRGAIHFLEELKRRTRKMWSDFILNVMMLVLGVLIGVEMEADRYENK